MIKEPRVGELYIAIKDCYGGWFKKGDLLLCLGPSSSVNAREYKGINITQAKEAYFFRTEIKSPHD